MSTATKKVEIKEEPPVLINHPHTQLGTENPVMEKIKAANLASLKEQTKEISGHPDVHTMKVVEEKKKKGKE